MRKFQNIKTTEPRRFSQGNDLCKFDQRAVLAKYVHRYTGDFRPAWVAAMIHEQGIRPAVQFKDDREWLRKTQFAVLANGRLDDVWYCHSTPTWPQGQKGKRVGKPNPPVSQPLVWYVRPAAAKRSVRQQRLAA